jgi:SAM-dependent methyltransferase
VHAHHHIAQRTRYVRNLAASLKPDGRLVVIDFKLDAPHKFLPYRYVLVFARP